MAINIIHLIGIFCLMQIAVEAKAQSVGSQVYLVKAKVGRTKIVDENAYPRIAHSQIEIEEVLQGNQELAGRVTEVLSSENRVLGTNILYVFQPMLEEGAVGVFAFNADAKTSHIDAIPHILADGTSLPLIKKKHEKFESALNSLRDRRDHPEKYPSSKPPPQPTQPSVPATPPAPPVPAVPVIKAELQKPPVPVPPADAGPSSESSPVLVWGAVVIVVLAVCVVMLLRRQTSSP